ncbi:MAG: hypothetical protein R2755_22500 [Acidimicrobiales bacterium]
MEELRERAAGRLELLREAGQDTARLYGHDADDGVGGFGAFFLLLDEPEVYRLPPDPRTTTRDLAGMWKQAAGAAAALAALALAVTGVRGDRPRLAAGATPAASHRQRRRPRGRRRA